MNLNIHQQTKNKTFDLELLSEMLVESITDILDFFDIPYQDSLTNISFRCPIHGSDTDFSSSILKQDIGNWICYTQQCHENYGTSNGASILQFLQALLTNEYEKPYTFPQTVEWGAKFVGIEPTTETLDNDRVNFVKLCNYLNRNTSEFGYKLPRQSVKQFLSIPSSYYIKRGYTRNILEKFDIGYCHNKNKPFYDRIVAPFYDHSGNYMIGYSSRNRYEKCNKCNLYHDPNVRCPISSDEKRRCSKWKNSSLKLGGYLYNFWNAKQHIENTNTVILVEGPGDVWRLEEAGIYNSVAILKASISREQIYNLESSGTINILLALDMDDAGNRGAESIIRECGHLFNIKRIEYPTNDLGDLSIQQAQKIFLPILEKL